MFPPHCQLQAQHSELSEFAAKATQHLQLYIYSCRYICICEIHRCLRGHSPSAAAIRLMSSSTTGDGQQQQRQLLDQANCSLSLSLPLCPLPSSPAAAPLCCCCVCVCVLQLNKKIFQLFNTLAEGKQTQQAFSLSGYVSLPLSLSPVSLTFRHNFQLENSAKMFENVQNCNWIVWNCIFIWFPFEAKLMTKFVFWFCWCFDGWRCCWNWATNRNWIEYYLTTYPLLLCTSLAAQFACPLP